MKLAFSTLGCPEWDIEKIVEKALEYGYDGVELRAAGRQHVDVDMSYPDRCRVRKLFEENNLAVCCLSAYIALGDNNQLEYQTNDLLHLIDLAVDLKAQGVRIFADKPDTVTFDCAVSNIINALSRCGKYAYDKGVGIWIETHHDFKSGYQMSHIMNKFTECKEIGVIWDIHHSISEGENPEDTLCCIGPKIRHVHIKDALRKENGVDKVCLVGEGYLPIHKIAGLLYEAGYDGYLSFEWEKMWIKELEEPEEAFPVFVRHMRELLKNTEVSK